MALAAARQISHPPMNQDRLTQRILLAAALLAGAGLLAEHGFYTPLLPIALCQAVQAVAVVLLLVCRGVPAVHELVRHKRVSRYWLDLAIVPAAVLAAAWQDLSPWVTALAAGSMYLVARQAGLETLAVARRIVAATSAGAVSRGRAIGLLLGSYLLLIVLGGGLLALPAATISDHRNAPYTHSLNSLFTATSAATLTGLSVYDFAGEYTRFGQIVVLALVQVGTLGILTFGTLFGMLLVRRLLSADARQPDADRQWKLVKVLAAATIGLQAVGAVLLYPLWAEQVDGLDRLLYPVFHAVSAFGNAGFSPDPANLVELGTAWQVYGVILPLMVLGGLGFPVLYEIAWRARTGLAPNRSGSDEALLPLPPRGWSIHTRLVLAATIWLVVIGTLGLLFFETRWSHGGWWFAGKAQLLAVEDAVRASPQSMAGHNGPQRFFDGLFQSISARTAGFKTVLLKTGAISPASLLLLMLLMLAGGSPASTAGGIKTITLAVVLLAGAAVIRRRRGVRVDGQALPGETVRLAAVLMLGMFGWLALTILVLAHMQRSDFLVVAFEAVSAISTTGWTLGLTPSLTMVGKVMVLLTMLVGRLGPLVLVLLAAGAEPAQPQDEHVVWG